MVHVGVTLNSNGHVGGTLNSNGHVGCNGHLGCGRHRGLRLEDTRHVLLNR